MNISTFPTDNLYKFCALFGTVIILASLYFPHVLLSELCKQVSFVDLKVATAKAEIDHFQLKSKIVEETVQNSIARNKGTYKPSPDKLELTHSDKELRGLIFENLNNLKLAKTSEAELANYIDESERLLAEQKLINSLAVISVTLGFMLSLFGYLSWYFKIQRYQDKALKDSINTTRSHLRNSDSVDTNR